MSADRQERKTAAPSKLVVDVVLLVGAGLAFASGLVLLFRFHMGHGSLRPEALGLSRLAWQNLHRLGAVLALAGVVAHVVLNGRGIFRRTLRVLHGKPMRHDIHELAVYVCNAIVLVTGFVVWLVVGGSMPILGPALLERVAANRHPWIDTHHLIGMVALILSINHVRRRWGALSVLIERARSRVVASAGATLPQGSAALPGRGGRGRVEMKPRRPPGQRHGTGFIALNTRLCQACWECVHACPQAVLGKVVFLWHRHAHVDRADDCTGCRKCLRSCKHGAITAVARTVHSSSPPTISVDVRRKKAPIGWTTDDAGGP
jgi:ferredoxin